METRIRFSSIIYVSRIDVSSSQIRLELRFEDAALKILSEKDRRLGVSSIRCTQYFSTR